MGARLISLLTIAAATPAMAQLDLPRVGQAVGSILDNATERLGRIDIGDAARPLRSVAELAQARVARLADFARTHRDSVELDDRGDPARRGVVLLLDADPASLAVAERLGFSANPREEFSHLGLASTELGVPSGMDLADAIASLQKALPDKTVTADQLHFPSGTASVAAWAAAAPAAAAGIRTRVGIIDGGVAQAVPVSAARGFARGAPVASDHGTAVASLLRHAGVQTILAADVYGHDAAGGGAQAIVRALDWLLGGKVPVISISLAGPGNPLLARAVAAADARGAVILAAVGNDGPAAPPVFPASYPSVLAITGVDGRDRALIEAGRAAHLDYAAPGADMKALDGRGRWRAVRGTSFAVPLAAARAAAMIDRGGDAKAVRPALDRDARDLGRKGPDPVFGRGLLCAACRPR